MDQIRWLHITLFFLLLFFPILSKLKSHSHLQKDAEKNKLEHKLPSSIAVEGTLVKYTVDRNVDEILSHELFLMVTRLNRINPFVATVLSMQENIFKHYSYRNSDAWILGHIWNKLTNPIPQNQIVFEINGFFGSRCALSTLDADDDYTPIFPAIRKLLALPFLGELPITCEASISLCLHGDLSLYSRFLKKPDHALAIQFIIVSGPKFKICAKSFADHCMQSCLQYLSEPGIILISLTIGDTKLTADSIKVAGDDVATQTIVAACKAKQKIAANLFIELFNEYVPVELNFYLIYHNVTHDSFVTCFEQDPEAINTVVFDNQDDAVQFLEVIKICEENDNKKKKNIHKEICHDSYCKKLVKQIEQNGERKLFPNYLINLLKLKILKEDKEGTIQIYRFFDDFLLTGKTLVAIKSLIMLERVIQTKTLSRVFASQIDDTVLKHQANVTERLCSEIVHANELIFFDRTMLNYTIPLENFQAKIHEWNDWNGILKSIQSLKDVFTTLMHACSCCWLNWLGKRNDKIWYNSINLFEHNKW